MNESLGKSSHLNIENLLTRSLHIISRRDERCRIYLTLKNEVVWLYRMTIHETHLWQRVAQRCRTLGIDEGGIVTTLCTHLLVVNLGDYKLWLE